MIYNTCICRYVMCAFITQETLNYDVRIFSHYKSMYIKLIRIIMDAIVSPENHSCWVDFASISTIFLLEFGTDHFIIQFVFLVFCFVFAFCFCFLFSFGLLFLILVCFLLFGNSYVLGIILTCNDIKLIYACNLVHIMNISLYDASHFIIQFVFLVFCFVFVFRFCFILFYKSFLVFGLLVFFLFVLFFLVTPTTLE